MALKELKVNKNIVDVALLDNDAGLVEIAILQQNAINVFHWALDRQPISSPLLSASYDDICLPEGLCFQPYTMKFHQIAFLSTEYVLVLGTDPTGSSIFEFGIHEGSIQPLEVFRKSFVKEILSMPWFEPAVAFSWLHDNRVVPIEGNPHTDWGPDAISHLPNRTDLVSLSANMDSTLSGDQEPLSNPSFMTFALTKSGHLYANDTCLARDCTSFIHTSSHLIFTTSQHLLKFVHQREPKGESFLPMNIQIAD